MYVSLINVPRCSTLETAYLKSHDNSDARPDPFWMLKNEQFISWIFIKLSHGSQEGRTKEATSAGVACTCGGQGGSGVNAAQDERAEASWSASGWHER
jgi:hypothetical protein